MTGKIEKLSDHRRAKELNKAGPGDHAPDARNKPARCPICRKTAAECHRPFCSKRCADIDLGRWLGEGYRIPAETLENAQDNDDSGES
ncbi:MAG: DNA gyrase inhibitor YacG [Dongiaceae bacterium]